MKMIMLALLVVFGCSNKNDADLVLLNGKVATVDSALSIVEAVAAKGDKILFVGSNSGAQKYITSNTTVIDAGGKLVVPGLIEGHAHFMGVGNALINLNLRTIKNWDDALDMVRTAVENAHPGEWIIGRGWHQEKWDKIPSGSVKGFPVHHDLSEISPDNPVMLGHASGHGVMVNAKALEISGINKNSENPAGGEIVKDNQGNPTGILLETAEELVNMQYKKYIEALSADEQKQRNLKILKVASDHCLENGITTFHDAGAYFKTLDLYKEQVEKGALDLRLWAMVSSEEFLNDSLLQHYKMIGYGNNYLTIRSIKQYADGALGSRGAWMLEPYSDMPGTSGLNVTPLDDIRRVANLALKNGYQLCTHAIGDRGNREMLNIYEETLNGNRDARWRIEHAQHLSLNDIHRFPQLGIIASMQTVHCTSDGPWVPVRIGNQRAEEGAYVWQKLLQQKTHIANGTDAPIESVNPIENYYAAVTRKLPDGNRFYPDQVLSREEALESLTIWNAYAGFEEDIKGSLEIGKLADLTVLSQDILTVPEDEILNTKVDYTIVGGKIKYSRRN